MRGTSLRKTVLERLPSRTSIASRMRLIASRKTVLERLPSRTRS
jgi:hypothetical protein